jgi:hypothetical protein
MIANKKLVRQIMVDQMVVGETVVVEKDNRIFCLSSKYKTVMISVLLKECGSY